MEEKQQQALLPSFEDFKHENGIAFWWASEFMTMLGYDDYDSFKSKVVGRATQALISLGVDHYSQITPAKRKVGSNDVDDLKLSRFACYIVAMNGNPQKKEVALAQAYFAAETRKLELFLEGNEDIARLIYREEFTAGQKFLMDHTPKAREEKNREFKKPSHQRRFNKNS